MVFVFFITYSNPYITNYSNIGIYLNVFIRFIFYINKVKTNSPINKELTVEGGFKVLMKRRFLLV